MCLLTPAQTHEELIAMPPEKRLGILHDAAMTMLQMYASGLITLPELTESVGRLGAEIGNVSGLIDPATGLRL